MQGYCTKATITITTSALKEDMEARKAEYVGQSIEKQHTIEPIGVFFENVARIDPADPSSPKVGIGRFHAEIWVLSWFGIDFSNFTKAQLVAVRFFFDALFPFLLSMAEHIAKCTAQSFVRKAPSRIARHVSRRPCASRYAGARGRAA